MKIAVSVESTNDLSKELLEKYDIKVVPFLINIADNSFRDGEHTSEEVFAMVEKYNQLPKTTALNEFEYTEWYESLKKDYDAVIHIALSSGITSSCGNAIGAAKNVENCYVVDSLSLTTGIGLLAIYARQLADQGVEPQEIQKLVSERTANLQVSFVIERLDYLYKGGRCNSLQYLGANILKIRPRVVIKNGKMLSDKKYRGNMNFVVSKYCQETLDEFNTPDLDIAFITYTTAQPEMIEEARKALTERGFKNIYETRAGATVACHCGANTIGVIYFNDGKNN